MSDLLISMQIMKKTGLAVEIEDERGQRYAQPTAEQFNKLLTSLGERWNTWLVVNRIPARDEDYFQVLREAECAYRVEVCAGEPKAHVATVIESPSDIERSFVLWASAKGDESAEGEEPWRLGRTWVPFEELDSKVEPEPPIAAEAMENARRLIACGYLSLPEVADTLVDMQEYDYEEEDEDGDDGGEKPQQLMYPQARRIAEAVWKERLAEQATWPERTDADAVEAAFEQLDSQGVVARANFACCSSCARMEIGAEMEDDSRGYVFFHYQTTETAVQSGELYLYFGAREPHSAEDVAGEIVGRLEDEGLPVLWNGEADTAIKVAPIEWRKRIGVQA